MPRRRFPHRLTRISPLPVSRRYLFLQIVSAVQHCHHRNIVYRDVKLVNVLLDGSEPPVVQLCDFGVAKRAGEGTGGDIHRLTTFTGTAGFLAPEASVPSFGPLSLPRACLRCKLGGRTNHRFAARRGL